MMRLLSGRLQVNVKDLYLERSGTPPGCDLINLAFPVVGVLGDHRKVVIMTRTPEGCQTSQSILLVKFDIRRVEKLSDMVIVQAEEG